MLYKLNQLFDKISQKGGIVLLVLMICIPAYFLIAKKLGYKYRKQLFGTRKIVEQGTDIPLEGDLLPASFVIVNQERIFPRRDDMLKAYFIRWILEGRIRVLDSVPKQPYPVYLFPEKGAPEGEYEKEVFKFVKKAAGSDLMLTRYKCYKWGEKDHVFQSNLKEQQLIWFETHDFIEKEKLINVILSPEGAAAARKVVELENYLDALIAGATSVAPEPDKIAYYVQFAILYGNWPSFKAVLEQYTDCCIRLAELLHCSPDKVVDTIENARLSIEKMEEGADDADDRDLG